MISLSAVYLKNGTFAACNHDERTVVLKNSDFLCELPFYQRYQPHVQAINNLGCKSFILGLDHAKRSVVRGLRISSLRGKLAVSKNKRAIS